jgi:hypothetical protein
MMLQNPALLPKVRSDTLLRSTRHMPCALRVASFYPGHRCAAEDTVVPCHLDRTIGKGIGTKVSDLFVVAGCAHCHDILDGRDVTRRAYILENYPTAFVERCLKGLAETQSRWVDMGALVGEDWEVVK